MIEIEKYFSAVLDNKIPACEKLKQAADKILQDYAQPGRFHFDPELANRHIIFIETVCKRPSGRLGMPLELELFQKARLQALFGFVDDNDKRKYNECLIIEGRKNGKTTECAAVELAMLCNDREGAPQIYNVATAKDQANLGFTAALKMREMSPLLRKHTRKRTSDIYLPSNMGTIRALASNTNTLDGLDVHCAIIDELAAIKNRDLYDLVKQGTTAREQPLIFCITTNGFIRNGIFDSQYEYAAGVLSGDIDDENFLPLIYELDNLKEWTDPKKWMKANPGLGTIKSFEKLKANVEKAKVDATFKPTVLVKDFDLKQNSASGWLTYEELNNEETFKIKFKYGIGAFDAADTTDLNAAKVLFKRPDDPKLYVRSMYWIPEEVLEQNNGSRRERDNAPYKLWVEKGYMRTCPGNKCDKRIFLEWFEELREQEGIYIPFIGYDPWHIGDADLREYKGTFGPRSMMPVRQGVYTLSEPMKQLAAEFKAHRVIYNNNPIDKWCLLNTSVKTDINGNIQPVKGSDQRNRIDGTAALLDGFVVLQNVADKYIGLNSGVE